MRRTLLMIALLVTMGSVVLSADDPSVLFSDDFSTADPAWGNDDSFSIAGGKFTIKPPAKDWRISLYQGTTFDDVDVTVKITQTAGANDSPSGLAFWGSDSDNFYLAKIEGDGYLWVARLLKDKWLDPVASKKYDTVKMGLNQINELRVVTKGKSATIYLNGQQATTFNGFPPTDGSMVGVYAESEDTAGTWTFDDFVVRKPK